MNKTDNPTIIYSNFGEYFIITDQWPNHKWICGIDKTSTPKAWKILFLKGILPKKGLNMEIDKELFNLLYDIIQKE